MSKAIDVDDYKTWLPNLHDQLINEVPKDVLKNLNGIEAKYREDYEGHLLNKIDAAALYLKINQWINENDFIGHHSTRLSNEAKLSIETSGLISLPFQNREARLLSLIEEHKPSLFSEGIQTKVRVIIQEYKNRDNGGIFFSLSKEYLKKECPEYLCYGSEFDRCVLVEALGQYMFKYCNCPGTPWNNFLA